MSSPVLKPCQNVDALVPVSLKTLADRAVLVQADRDMT